MVSYLGVRKGLHVFKVRYQYDFYKVTFTKEGDFDNLCYYHSPKRRNFQSEEEFIEAESIDTDVFCAITENVEDFIKNTGLFTVGLV